jgi:hypothetical protein
MKSWRIVTLSIVLVGIIAPVRAEFTTWVPPSVRDGLIEIAPPVGAALALVLYFNWRTRSYPGALFFSAGGYHHHLGTNTWSPGPPARADEAKLLEWGTSGSGTSPHP